MKRFPGIQPFSKDFKEVFYGRSADIETLYKFLNVNKLVVLHGKSGLGKSSLINAGLLPEIERVKDYQFLFVRFGTYQPLNPTTPKKIIAGKIIEMLPEANGLFFPELENDKTRISLWQYYKSLQWEYRKKEGILLVLDQFEEIFTYPDIYIQQFAEEFSKLVDERIPDYLQNRIYQKAKTDEGFFDRHAEEIEFVETNPSTKILISIRSDKLSLVDRITPYIPGILRNTYELHPLKKEQAREAIVKPSSKEGSQFDSPPFELEKEYLNQVLDFLASERNQTVEPFILQILCQYFEGKTVNLQKNSEAGHIVIDSKGMVPLQQIVHNYYIHVLNSKGENGEDEFKELERILIRDLVERKLIDPVYNTRISLDKSVVLQGGIEEPLLNKLVDARLIRQEPNTVSGLSYEISHDTLIDPILNSANVIGNLEEDITAFYRKYVTEEEQLVLEKYFFDDSGGQKGFEESEFELTGIEESSNSENEDLESIMKTLHEEKILRKYSTSDNRNAFGLYPIFGKACQKIKEERATSNLETVEKKQKRDRRLFTYASTLSLLILSLLVFSIWQWNRANNNSKKLTEANESLMKANEEAKKYHNQLMEELKTEYTSKIKYLEEYGFTMEESELLSKYSDYSGQDDTRAFAYLAEAYKLSKDSRVIKGYVYRMLGNPDIYFYSKILDAKSGIVYSGDFSPKNDLIITSYPDGTVYTWDFQGEKIDSFPRHTRDIYAVTFSPDGKQILTSGYDYTARLTNLEGGEVRIFGKHKQGVKTVAFSPDGQKILTGSIDNTAILWNASTAKELATLGPHGEDVMHVAFAPKDSIILTASFDRIARIWDYSGNKLDSLPAHKGEVTMAIFSPSGDTIATSSKPTTSLWDLKNKNPELITFTDHKKTVSAIDFSSDGRFLVSASWDKTAFVRELSTGDTFRLKGHTELLRDVDFSHDDKYILTCSNDSTAKLWQWPLKHSPLRQKIINAYSAQMPLDSIKNDLALFISQNDFSTFKTTENENYVRNLSSIKGTGVQIRRTPEISEQHGHIILQLNTGDQVSVLREYIPPKDSIPWYQIRSGNKLGWVRSDFVEKNNPLPSQ